MLKLSYIFGHILTVKSRCYDRLYDRCYVEKLVPLSTFLKFHTHLEINSARLFQNVFIEQVFKGLKSWIFKNWNFLWTSPHFFVRVTLRFCMISITMLSTRSHLTINNCCVKSIRSEIKSNQILYLTFTSDKNEC